MFHKHDSTHVQPLSEIYTVICCLEKTNQAAVRETVCRVAEGRYVLSIREDPITD